MTQSFQLISNKTDVPEINKVVSRMRQYFKVVEIIDWHPYTLVIAGNDQIKNHFTHNEKQIVFIDYPFNISHSQQEIDYYFSENWDLITPYSIHSMLLYYDRNTQKTSIYNPLPGIIPVYIYQVNNQLIWIGSELKYWIQCKNIRLKSFPFFNEMEGYLSPLTSETVWENIKRLQPTNTLQITETDYTTWKSDTVLKIDNDHDDQFWVEQLYEILNHTIDEQKFDNASPICLALSGGFDSGSIAALLANKNIPTVTVTIGTQKRNERKEAQLTAKKFNITNHYGEIKPNDYFEMYFSSVWFNEITQPEIAAGYPGLYKSYSLSNQHGDKIITGYGADLLLGDIFNIGHQKLDEFQKHILIKTSMSGEISPYLANNLNTQTIPLYLHPDVIMLCRKIPGFVKTKNGIYKYIQKEMIKKYTMIPDELLEIDKSGLHTGAGLPQMFSELTNNYSHETDFKKKFLYATLQLMFEKAIPYKELTIEKIITQINNEFN